MSHECSECGKDFDTERGLNIHKSQMHDEEENQENNVEENDNTEREEVKESSSQQSITLTAKQFGGITFATGLFLGLALGVMFGGFSGVPTETVGAPTVDNSGNNDGESPSGSGIVELSNAEYPYGDLEAGVGSGEKTYGDTTFKLDGEPYIGSPDAEVTAVSYEDFQCPYCKSYNDNAYPQIVENYVRTGEVQYFYKHIPLGRHPWAEPAALASECALNQNAEAFWTFKQGFFNNQDQLGNAFDNSNFDASMYQWAEQTNLDTDQFRQCYDNQEEIDEVTQDKQEAAENEARATPTILINDQKIEGAQPYSRFESTIQSQLQ